MGTVPLPGVAANAVVAVTLALPQDVDVPLEAPTIGKTGQVLSGQDRTPAWVTPTEKASKNRVVRNRISRGQYFRTPLSSAYSVTAALAICM